MEELDLLREWDTGQQEGNIAESIARTTAIRKARAFGLLMRWREAGGNGRATAKLAVEAGVGLRWMQDKLAAARKVLK